jgi:transcriptional regulator with XRE-family HTH domain
MQTRKRRRKPKAVFPLKQVLAAKGVSQNKLARSTRIALCTINAIANGRQQPKWPMILRLATTLGADLGDFQPGREVTNGHTA